MYVELGYWDNTYSDISDVLLITGSITESTMLSGTTTIFKELSQNTAYGSSNFQIYSENFNSGGYSLGTVTVLNDVTTAPDGTLTADHVVLNNTLSFNANDGSGIKLGASETASKRLTSYSVYAKAGALTSLMFRNNWYGAGPIFNLNAGTVSAYGIGFSTIKPVGNGWFRCTQTFAPPNTSNNGVSLRPYAATGNSNGVDGVYLWGVQIEYDYVTPYVKTTGAKVFNANINASSVISEVTLLSGTQSVSVSLLGSITESTILSSTQSVSVSLLGSITESTILSSTCAFYTSFSTVLSEDSVLSGIVNLTYIVNLAALYTIQIDYVCNDGLFAAEQTFELTQIKSTLSTVMDSVEAFNRQMEKTVQASTAMLATEVLAAFVR